MVYLLSRFPRHFPVFPGFPGFPGFPRHLPLFPGLSIFPGLSPRLSRLSRTTSCSIKCCMLVLRKRVLKALFQLIAEI